MTESEGCLQTPTLIPVAQFQVDTFCIAATADNAPDEEMPD